MRLRNSLDPNDCTENSDGVAVILNMVPDMTKPVMTQSLEISAISLLWRHNGRVSVSNHQPHDCLLNRLFRRRSKRISKLSVTGLCAGNSPGTGEFPAQMTSDAEKCFHLMTSSCLYSFVRALFWCINISADFRLLPIGINWVGSSTVAALALPNGQLIFSQIPWGRGKREEGRL